MILVFFKKILLSKAYKFSPSGLDQSKWKEVKVPMITGSIHCMEWRQTKKSLGVAILIHPYDNRGKEYFLDSGHPEMYHRLGYDVVVFDLNGFGKSDDKDFRFADNLLAVSGFFKSKYQSNEVIGHGISFGASVLITGLQFDHPFNHAIVENCLDEVRNYYKVRSKNLYRLIFLIELLFAPIKNNNRFYRAASKIKNLDKMLLIYSAEDPLTTPEMGEKIQAHCSIDCEYKLLKGKHMLSINEDSENYQKTIENYITRN